MSKVLIALAAGCAMAVTALPAIAQSYDAGVAQREDTLRDRINDGFNRGDLSAGQTARLRAELRQIVDLDARYQDDGLTGWRVRDLNSRLSLLSSRLNYDLGANTDFDNY